MEFSRTLIWASRDSLDSIPGKTVYKSGRERVSGFWKCWEGNCNTAVVTNVEWELSTVLWAPESYLHGWHLFNDTVTHMHRLLRNNFLTYFALSHVPFSWQKVNVGFIPKSGKITIQTFIQVSLTPFFLKLLKRLVDRYICAARSSQQNEN